MAERFKMTVFRTWDLPKGQAPLPPGEYIVQRVPNPYHTGSTWLVLEDEHGHPTQRGASEGHWRQWGASDGNYDNWKNDPSKPDDEDYRVIIEPLA